MVRIEAANIAVASFLCQLRVLQVIARHVRAFLIASRSFLYGYMLLGISG